MQLTTAFQTLLITSVVAAVPAGAAEDIELHERIAKLEESVEWLKERRTKVPHKLKASRDDGGSFEVTTFKRNQRLMFQSDSGPDGSWVLISFAEDGTPMISVRNAATGKVYRVSLESALSQAPGAEDITEGYDKAKLRTDQQVEKLTPMLNRIRGDDKP